MFVNAKALVFAGLFFEGEEADEWLQCGLRILNTQLPEQMLDDGGHFERSTMYHALALEDVLDLINVCRAYEVDVVCRDFLPQLDARVESMRSWLTAMCHPDGEISFFNDAALGVSPSVEELHGYALRLGYSAVAGSCSAGASHPVVATPLTESGYVRLESRDAVAMLDVAPVGPDYLPGHAHADTLSFEMSIRGQRVFVNSGTSVYGTSDERLRQRGTAAHNTVVVSDRDSSEVWSGFRVARRAYPHNLRIAVSDRQACIRCEHDGYQKTLKPPVVHGREWRFTSTGLEVLDELLPVENGSAQVAEARLHLHPSIVTRDVSIKSIHLMLPDGGEVAIKALANIRVEESTYHPYFGVAEASKCVVLPLVDGKASVAISW